MILQYTSGTNIRFRLSRTNTEAAQKHTLALTKFENVDKFYVIRLKTPTDEPKKKISTDDSKKLNKRKRHRFRTTI